MKSFLKDDEFTAKDNANLMGGIKWLRSASEESRQALLEGLEMLNGKGKGNSAGAWVAQLIHNFAVLGLGRVLLGSEMMDEELRKLASKQNCKKPRKNPKI